MTLSVCCMTADSGARVAALLAQLRPVADEIVVAADGRVEGADLGAYASVADKLLRVEYEHNERHLGWLHAQCDGDWILRMDGDELVSPALIEQLPGLLARRDVHQYLIPRRWLHPDAEHWLDELPWWPDYQVRLVRNDGLLRFSGERHTSAVPARPAVYLEAPLLHLDLLLSRPRERMSKLLRYVARRPGLEAPGGGELNERFYLPERHARREPAELDEAERAAVREVLEADLPPPRDPGDLPLVTTAEMDRHWPGRPLLESAYRASIAPLERDVRMTIGERRPLHFRFENLGTETWPWDADLGPTIRASYRWRNLSGTLVTSDGLRSAFPADVPPGAAAVVPLDVIAPQLPGGYMLEVDLVHEWVRWFESGAEPVYVLVEPRTQSARLRRRLPGLPRRGRGGEVPHTIHRIWLGEEEMPDELRRYGEGWAEQHPDWEIRTWGGEDYRRLVPAAARERARQVAEASDLLRYEILSRHGGVYLDTDVECRRPLDPLLEGVSAFAAWEAPHRVGTAVLGSAPGHPAFVDAAREARETAGLGPDSAFSTGPGFLTVVLAEHPDVTIFDSSLFYPYGWDEPRPPDDAIDGAYAVHHWAGATDRSEQPTV